MRRSPPAPGWDHILGTKMWMRKSRTGKTTKSKSKNIMPFVEISLPVCAAGEFSQSGQPQATSVSSHPHSEHVVRPMLALSLRCPAIAGHHPLSAPGLRGKAMTIAFLPGMFGAPDPCR